MSKFTASQISAFRLSRHHLVKDDSSTIVSLCRDVCGIQAQLQSAAEVAFWARMHRVRKAEISAALYKSRRLVRTSLMRQTLHIIPSADLGLYIAALRRSRRAFLMRILSRFGVTAKDTDDLNESILELLKTGPKSQAEIAANVLPKTSKGMKRYMKLAWGIQLFRSALVEGLICYGPLDGNQSTFVRSDQWLPRYREFTDQRAKEELIRRYLSAYGPATPQDFSRWSGISEKETADTWRSLHNELTEVWVREKNTWLLRKDLESLSRRELLRPVLRLLPSFDSYLLAHDEKTDVIDNRFYKRVYRNQGWISPVVLLDGRIVGTWSVHHRQKRASVEIVPFQTYSRRIREAIEKECVDLGRFMETTFEIIFR